MSQEQLEQEQLEQEQLEQMSSFIQFIHAFIDVENSALIELSSSLNRALIVP